MKRLISNMCTRRVSGITIMRYAQSQKNGKTKKTKFQNRIAKTLKFEFISLFIYRGGNIPRFPITNYMYNSFTL